MNRLFGATKKEEPAPPKKEEPKAPEAPPKKVTVPLSEQQAKVLQFAYSSKTKFANYLRQ